MGVNMPQPKYHRVILKLSGEALAGEQGFGINLDVVNMISAEIREVVGQGVEVAVVVGGGNIWRGEAGSAKGMDRTTADYMGMLATTINALALQDSLEKLGVETGAKCHRMRQSQNTSAGGSAPFGKGRVVIFASGTGNPYFSTIDGRPGRRD